jgi:DNA-binding LytR/AlgR family response regulator
MKKLTCIAVDDEPFALDMVCSYIQQTPFLELQGRFSSALEALQALHNHDIDLVFLDIQMPELTGIELARILDRGRKMKGPRVIFTTAYDQFALEGYKVDALDYLLKPFDYEEFLRAVQKAHTYASMEKTQEPAATTKAAEPEFIFLRVEHQLVRVNLSDIRFIQGLKDYVKVYLTNRKHPLITLINMKTLEEKLPREQFMRIHRSYIISLDKIDTVSKGSVEIGDESIPVGNHYKDNFKQLIDRWTS